MQILCRKEKNNPLHIGEPGVGKTAVVYGLARLLSEGKVPEPLKGAKIYALDLEECWRAPSTGETLKKG